MDIVDIDGDISIQELDIDLDIEEDNLINDKPSVNFGSGIELLMNDKTKNDSKKSSNIDLDDINKLENDLNDLNDLNDINKSNDSINEIKNIENKENKKSLFGNFDFFAKNDDKKNGKNIKTVEETKENLGKSTSKINENKTWDGYSKLNNIPETKEPPKLSKEEEMKEKFKYLKKLEDLEKKGVNLSKRYNMDSDLKEMIGEYETIIAEKEKSNAIKFQGKMLMACITGIEFLNNKFDPFDIKLDGWGEQLNENIEEYDEIFAELHEKYKSKAKMAPELKLLFQLGGSAMMIHMSNTLFKSSMPGMDDIMRQNPELMKQFTNAAVNTMGKSNPGFGGFMNGLFGNGENSQRQNGVGSGANPGFGIFPGVEREMPEVINEGPLPEPTETKLPQRSQRPQNFSNRPDLMSARGNMSVSNNYGNPKNEDKISRPELKPPSINKTDISNLLGNLKTKQVDINNETKDGSTISLEELKDLNGAKMPKTKRKNKSDKNIVSIDI
jgi:hypothetical protein